MTPDIVQLFRRLFGPWQRAIVLMVERGVVTLSDDSGPLQTVQLTGMGGQALGQRQVMGQYGFASRMQQGAETVAVSVGAQRAHQVVIAVGDRRFRLTGLAEGEVAIHDDQGQKAHLTRSGIVIDGAGFPVNIRTTGDIILTPGGKVQLGGTGGKKVALDGDPVVGGAVQASSTMTLAL